MTTELFIFGVVQIAGVIFMCGLYKKTVDRNSKDIGDIRKDVDVHDREIGAVYGELHMQRTVAR